jgi:hypothetical protein
LECFSFALELPLPPWQWAGFTSRAYWDVGSTLRNVGVAIATMEKKVGQKKGSHLYTPMEINQKQKTWGCYGEQATCDFDWGIPTTCALAKNTSAVNCVSCEVCEEINSHQTEMFEIFAAKVPVTLCFVVVISISMMLLYRTVRKTELMSRR